MWAWLPILLVWIAQAPRDAHTSGTSTATIAGRIIDRDSKRAIPGALVSIRDSSSLPAITTRADGDGRYELSGLAPGDYAVWASAGELRATHLSQVFGQTGSMNRMVPPPLTLTLKAGEVRSDIDFALVRALAIEGRVLDARDEPMAGVEVEVVRANGLPSAGPEVFSDDRGGYRVFGLAPGRYRVCATPHYFFSDDRPLSASRLVRTCYLASITEAGGADVLLESADALGIDIRVQRSATYSISGTVIDASGVAVENARVSAVRNDLRAAANGQTHAGQFVLEGLTAGRYLVRAGVGGPDNFDEARPVAREEETGETIVLVDANDVSNVALTLSRPSHVSGHVVFEGDPPRPSRQLHLSVGLTTVRDDWGDDGFHPIPVDDSLAFELKNVPGRPSAVFIQGLPDGWIMKSVRYDDRDITGVAVDLSGTSPQSRLQIVVTNAVAWASVRVTDARGEAVTSYMPIVVPADPKRRLFSITTDGMPSRDGVVKLGPALPGDYLIAAVGPDDYWLLQRQPDRLDDLAPLAQRV
ncbi:MAG TPA: carboxypeptidase-like regulatory domain-containing protein, partial [Vicinamibacterales bacterium]